jgi:hypothetical protein
MPTGAMRGKFSSLLEQYKSGPQAAFDDFVAWFKASAPMKVGDKVHTADGYFVLEQIFFDLQAKNDAEEGQYLLKNGDETFRDPKDQLFSEDFDYFDYADAGQRVLIWKLQVSLHWGEAHPEVMIAPPSDGASVVGLVQIGTLCTAIDSLEFFLDGSRIGPASAEQFSMYWDTGGTSVGDHEITAVGRFGD